MPKPTQDEIWRIIHAYTSDPAGANETAIRISALIDAWEADGGGAGSCDAVSDPPRPSAPRWEDVTVSSGGEDLSSSNAAQRLRREAYAAALDELGYIAMGSPVERAAARYPLKKRVPKPPIPDPHGYGKWRAEYDSNAKCWHAVWREGEPAFGWQADHCYLPMLFTAERLHALATLLDDPWEIVEDTEPEEAT